MQFLFRTPIPQPFGRPECTGVEVVSAIIDLETGDVTVHAMLIEDQGPGMGKRVAVPLDTLANLQAHIKSALAVAFNVTFA